MKTNYHHPIRYSLTIKRQVIRRIESGELNASSAAREYGIGGSMTIARWLSQRDRILGDTIPNMKKSPLDRPSQKSKEELLAELAVMRQLLEYERTRSEAYLTMIKIAEERFKIPIEKKSGPKQLKK